MADTIPAILEEDEYVLNKNAVKVIGKENLDRINFGIAPREGYSHGGSAPKDLLGRTQEGGYTIPAGKNIFGQPTEEMGPEELMEMIMPGGGAKATLQMGKGGIRAILSSNKEDILKSLAKMRKTGKGSKKIAEAVDWQTELQKYLKQATSRRFTNPVKKQRGGSIDDYSLMDYMMPAMDKRLGTPLRKMQYGGGVDQYEDRDMQPQPGDPNYNEYLQEMEQWQQQQQQQNMPGQYSGNFSTSFGSIFEEAGFKTPDAEDYSLEAYDPTKQQRLQKGLGRKMPGVGGTGAGGFAGPTGAEMREAGEEREMFTEKYQQGAEDLRKKYREDTLAQIKEDVLNEIYEFEDLA